MIDTHKNVIKYQVQHELHYVNNPTSLMQMARISLIDKKLFSQNGRNIILFDVYFGKLFNFNISIMIQYSSSNKKTGDTPNATLIFKNVLSHNTIMQINCNKKVYFTRSTSIIVVYLEPILYNEKWLKQNHGSICQSCCIVVYLNDRVPNFFFHFSNQQYRNRLSYFKISLSII